MIGFFVQENGKIFENAREISFNDEHREPSPVLYVFFAISGDTETQEKSYIDLFRCLAYNTYCNRVRLQWMRFRMDSALSGLQPKPNPRTSENRSSKLDIEWNITKFVIEQEGNFLARFEPAADMAYVETCVKALL